ncbi:sigma-70 family RNA polymerase sigma factor [Oceaniovalibus sp. ACAM 378]|uniref:sigma-70 family RNA polymerase sigma factor n=1 Tax=Oceaniovalibus sp. ACAM 378 TaxID=2599923 RepID=UPI0011DAA1DF|nr:sigma-70 family RNA polymerase sigma factor [Oceaniovalibus sp. ACAM 378]TYB87673.1 sigma-70 family RNA polymerase sigma factor [Oceaniovalibus sp. ACAM 378]
MTTTIDIERWINATASGDRAAFLALYDATNAKLFGVCLRVLRDRAEAEEVLQDVFLKIWRNSGLYQANGFSPMTWLITVARNGAIDRLRARKSRGEMVDLVAELPDHGPTPEAAAIASSDNAQMQMCLGQLEPDRADAVRGAYLDGMSYQELAERYTVPLNTMRTWLRRSLLKLKECLTE